MNNSKKRKKIFFSPKVGLVYMKQEKALHPMERNKFKLREET